MSPVSPDGARMKRVTSDVYAAQPEPPAHPEPPVNVRVVYLDGGEDPVELVYDGEADGLHVWAAVPTAPLVSRYASVRWDSIPENTRIELRMAP